MNTIPTNAEVAFYLIFAAIALVSMLALLIRNEVYHDCTISDMDAWLRDYDKLQKR